MTVAAIEDFKRDVRGREVGSDETLDDYCRWIERFEQWNQAASPNETTLRRFDSYLADEHTTYPWEFTRPLNGRGYAYQTRIKALSALKLWLRYQYDEYVENEVQKMVLGKEPDFNPTVLSRRDIDKITIETEAACQADDCFAALVAGYDAIMRCAEIADARVGDINFETGSIYVRAKKGSLAKDIKLESETIEVLREHVDQIGNRKFLFYNSYGNRWKPKSLSTHFIRSHHSAGIHSFTRHSPIVHRLQNPRDFPGTMRPEDAFGQVFQRARHSHPTTTLRYARMVGIDVPDWVGE